MNYVQCLNLSLVEKTWFLASVEYSPNGKSIMAPMKYTPMVCSPSGKSMVLRKILFRSGNGPGKRWKKYNKKIMSIKFSFMHYMKWTSVMLAVVFEEFELVCFFAAAPSSSPPVPTDLSEAALQCCS